MNQQQEGAERVINRDDLAAWVSSPAAATALAAALQAQVLPPHLPSVVCLYVSVSLGTGEGQ